MVKVLNFSPLLVQVNHFFTFRPLFDCVVPLPCSHLIFLNSPTPTQVQVVDVNLREGKGFGTGRYSSSVSRHGSSSSGSGREGGGEECTDVIRVTDRGKTLLTMCGESKADVQILSHSSKLEVGRIPSQKAIYLM